MSERLTIENFVGLKNIDLEIGKINILIGPQATGKSVCAKLAYYFKNFYAILFKLIEAEGTVDILTKNLKRMFVKYFPSASWGDEPFIINYINGTITFSIERSKGSDDLEISISKNVGDLFDQVKNFYQDLNKNPVIDGYTSNGGFTSSQVLHHLRDKLKDDHAENAGFVQIFIPAGRSYFANLQGNIFTLLSEESSIDPFIINFGKLYENLKKVDFGKNKPTFESDRLYTQIEATIEELIETILNGKYWYEQGKDYLITNGRKISIINSSSGQQEVLPLSIILKHLDSFKVTTEGITVYIEEPEAHLFPSAQKDVVDLMSVIFNRCAGNLQYFITTHSPYILTSFNNLLYAGHLYASADAAKRSKLNEIIPEYMSLKFEDVKAYALENGTSRSILDEESGIIDAAVIDKVSNVISIQFGKLLEHD